MSEPFKLKYLFQAAFTDGTFLWQTPDDISALDPEKRSQFYDVLQSGKKIKKFTLVQVEPGTNIISVDLTTGLFNVNGLEVLLEGKKLPTLPDEFRLIFYRQRTENLNVTYDKKTGEIKDQKPADSFCEYFIGWQCTIAGKNYEQKIAVS